MQIGYFGICDKGLKREVNQDSLLMAARREQGMYLFAVADGMGGHADGELASRALTEGLKAWADGFRPELFGGNFRNMTISLQNRIEEINRKIYMEYNRSQVCGSTCVALFIYGDAYGVFSAGDSRIYLHRGFKTVSLMTDDVWENQVSVQEALTGKQIKNHPNFGKLVNAVGTGKEVSLSVRTDLLKKGDAFLLCSDGLYRYCPEKYLKKTLRGLAKGNLQESAKELLAKAYGQGAGDNVSVVLVKCAS